jgi:phage protein D
LLRLTRVGFPTTAIRPKYPWSVKIVQRRYAHDVAEVVFRDWHADMRNIKPGTPMVISVRTATNIGKSFFGYVHHVKHKKNPGQNLLQVVFIGASFSMRQSSQKVYKNLTASNLARRIAKKHKLAFDITPHPKVYKRISQAGLTDWELLVKYAKRCGYTFRVDGLKLIFKPFDEDYKLYKNRAPVFNLSLSVNPGLTSIYSFDPIIGEDLNYPDAQKAIVSVGGVNPYTGRSHKASKKNKKKFRRDVRPEVFDRYDTDLVSDSFETSKAFAEAKAEMNRFPYRATAKLRGNPRVRPDYPVILTGLGNEYSGPWITLSVEHIITTQNRQGQVYEMNVDVGLDSLGASDISWLNSENFSSTDGGSYGVSPEELQTLNPVNPSLITTIDSVAPYPNPVINEVQNANIEINPVTSTNSVWVSPIGDVRARLNIRRSNRSLTISERIRSKCC